MRDHRRIGQLLTNSGAVTEEELERALTVQRETGRLLGQVLIETGICTPEQVLAAVATQFRLPHVRVRETDLDSKIMSLIPAHLAYRHQVLPLRLEYQTLQVAISNPLDIAALDDIRLVTGLNVEPVLASPEEIRHLIEEHYMKTVMADVAEADEVEVLGTAEEEIGDLQDMAGGLLGGKETLVVKLVNLVLRQAVQDRASDVHIEPYEKGLRVRYRIDGILHPIPAPAKRMQAAVISRVKIMADMDITERRLPQDGRMKLRVHGKELDVRVSTVPTLFGESVVMRILDQSSVPLNLSDLGLLPSSQEQVARLIKRPHGIILATGPTGSGKTTTLYAALRQTASSEKKTITIEDPVEYRLEGINQIQVQPKAGLTFATGLRSILRQDPDIIMVGEIRDPETAGIAVHAALTGHLVFSTLHTNDAASAVVRLVEMEIEPYLVASSVIGVVAQRLVRVICPHCKETYEAPRELALELSRQGVDVEEGYPLSRGTGCERCKFTGYQGRMGIYEILMMDDEVRRLILRRAAANTLRDAACARGMSLLRRDGWEKVLQGLTTVEEVSRVTQEEELAEPLPGVGEDILELPLAWEGTRNLRRRAVPSTSS